MDRIARDRLRWKCRRGLLELDLVLQSFLDRHFEESDAIPLNDLLELHDNELWEIVSGRSDAYDAKLGGIVARLRAV